VVTSESFAEFVAQRSQRLLRTAYLLTRDWAYAEDLLQTALVRAWSVWSRIEDDPEPYVRRVLINSYFSWWRRRWRHAEQPVAELPDHPLADETALSDERQRVWLAMGRLPRRQRAVLVLRYFEDMTEAQIAGVLDISVGTVKSQANRALAKLRLDESLTLEESHG
jgi:RNA polymerase sigma-70 factor (sigma-E family)